MSIDVHIISNKIELHSEIIGKLEGAGYFFLEKYKEKTSNGEQHILAFYRQVFDLNLDTMKNKVRDELNKVIPNLYSDVQIRVFY